MNNTTYVNIVFLLALSCAVTLVAYIATRYDKTAETTNWTDYLPFVQEVAGWPKRPLNADKFDTLSDKQALKYNFEVQFGFNLPDGLEVEYSKMYQADSTTIYRMCLLKGRITDLRKVADRLHCGYTGMLDPTLETGGSAYKGVLPKGWRKMKLYHGTSPSDNDLRIYMDEEKGCAYITEQPKSVVISKTTI